MKMGHQLLVLMSNSKTFQKQVFLINQSYQGHRSDKKFTLIFTTMNSLYSLYLQGRDGGLKKHVLGLLQTGTLLMLRIQFWDNVRHLKCGMP